LTIGATGSFTLSAGTLSTATLSNSGTFEQSGGEFSGTEFGNNQDGLFRYAGGAFSGRLVNDGEAVFDLVDRIVFDADISGAGDLTKRGDGTLILTGENTYSGDTFVSSGVLQGNTRSLPGDITNNATVVFNQPQTGIYDDTISGSGNLVKQNGGLLIFNGQNSYTGGTRIDDGNLQIGDAAHPEARILGLVGVGPNAILSGYGTIDGNVENAGTISPGGSIGTLRVTGDVQFQPGSTFQVDINPTESDRLIVEGKASLGGAQVGVVAEDGAYGPNRYTILSAGSIEGRFGDQVTSNLASIDPLLTPSLAYDARSVYLDLELATRLQNPMAGATKVATDLVYMIDRMTTGRFNQALGELCSTSLGFWARGFGMVSSASATGAVPGFDGDTSGFLLGFDGQLTDRLSLGILGFSANVDVTTNTNFSDRSTVDLLGFNLYAAYTHWAWQVRSALGYSNESYSSRQTIGGGAQRRRAGGSTDANRISNYTEASYTFKSHGFSVQPTLAMQFGWMDQDAFTQRGLFTDGQNLNVSGRNQYVFDTLVGARARQEVSFGNNKKLQAELRAFYMHRFGELDDATDGALTGGQFVSLDTQDRPKARDVALLGAGVTLLTGANINLYADYNGQFLDNQTTSFFSAGMRYVW
jgi:outer membrane autotransporter protein